MPGPVTAIIGRTFGQIYTRTLPSSLKFLDTIGYRKDEDYVIGIRPPKKWKTPHETITKFDNFISFSNGTGFLLLSQEREGSARGPNIDREIVDEALTLNKERYDQEVSPANRQFDLDCYPSKALEVVPDRGSNLNLFSVGQERNFNFATKIIEPCDCLINEFFNKPQEIKKDSSFKIIR